MGKHTKNSMREQNGRPAALAVAPAPGAAANSGHHTPWAATLPPAPLRPAFAVAGLASAAAATLKLSVVIPMFNEEENLQATVDRVAAALREFRDGPWEIILVNDGSTDATWERGRALAARPEYASWLRIAGYARNRGRGYALRTGFAAARGEWITSTDADLSYDPKYILDLLAVLRREEDVDMVIASAYMPGGGVEGLEFKRRFVSQFGNRMLSWFMSPARHKVHTITCVFRAYRRHVLDSLDLESDGKDLHLEILSKAIMLGYHFKEVPVILRTRKKGKSKHVFMPTAASHLVFAIFERPILVFGLLGLLLILASMLGMGYVASVYLLNKLDPVHYNPFNTNRPLMTIIIMTFLGGIQLLSFGVIGTQFVNLRKENIRIQARLKALLSRRMD